MEVLLQWGQQSPDDGDDVGTLGDPEVGLLEAWHSLDGGGDVGARGSLR